MRTFAVKAKIYNIDGFSAHADKDELINWVKSFKKPPRKILLVHGELDAMFELQKAIESKLSLNVIIPEYRQSFILKPTDIESREISLTQKEVDFLFNAIKNKLDSMYESDVSRNKFDELYNKLKNIEEVI